MSQKLTILFDLDGTLIDTAPDLMSAHNHVMKKFGYIERELEDIKKLAGRGSKVMIKKSINTKKPQKSAKQLKKIKNRGGAGTRGPWPGPGSGPEVPGPGPAAIFHCFACFSRIFADLYEIYIYIYIGNM